MLGLLSTLSYILKAKKFAEPPFQSKNIAEKVRVIFGPFWVIFGHSWAILGHICATLGHFWAISWHFWKKLRKSSIFCGPVGVAGLAFRMYASILDTTTSISTLLCVDPYSNAMQ